MYKNKMVVVGGTANDVDLKDCHVLTIFGAVMMVMVVAALLAFLFVRGFCLFVCLFVCWMRTAVY